MVVAVIIPAYNEERTVARVIRAARSSPAVSRIIVVNDGSTDRTAAFARKAGAEVIDLPANMGKGAAVAEGVKATSAEDPPAARCGPGRAPPFPYPGAAGTGLAG